MDYMTLKEASQKWNVTPRQINYLCAAGRIPRRYESSYNLVDSQNCGETD